MSVTLYTYAITTVERYKLFAGLVDNTQDELIKLLINAVTDFIENQTGRRIKETVYTNKLISGDGGHILKLPAFPVSTSSSFTLQRKVDTNSWETVPADSYEIDYDTGLIRASAGFFNRGFSNYRVSYTGGYANIEAQCSDLEFASWRLIKKAMTKRSGSEGIQSQSLGNYSVVFSKEYFLSPDIKDIVDQYRVYNI